MSKDPPRTLRWLSTVSGVLLVVGGIAGLVTVNPLGAVISVYNIFFGLLILQDDEKLLILTATKFRDDFVGVLHSLFLFCGRLFLGFCLPGPLFASECRLWLRRRIGASGRGGGRWHRSWRWRRSCRRGYGCWCWRRSGLRRSTLLPLQGRLALGN